MIENKQIAAAQAVLDVIEEESLLDNVNKVGDYLMTELKKIPAIKEVRGKGLMIGIEFEQPIKEIRTKLLFEEHVFTGVSGTNASLDCGKSSQENNG